MSAFPSYRTFSHEHRANSPRSGAIESLIGPDHARYIPRRDPQTHEVKGNLLDVSRLGPGVRLLDPAVGSR